MTQEQKAKAYDKLFIKAKRIYNKENDVLIMHTIEDLFPEFKESEDEKIRKEIIDFIYDKTDTYELREKSNSWLAWLEKQDEQKPIIEMKSPEESLGISSKEYNDIVNECLYGETTSANKVEPKFKVGKWIVNNNSKDVYLIKSINNGYYTLEDIKGDIISPCLPPYESEFHLWTIQDAKDGDVLYASSFSSDCIFVFDRLDKWKFDEPNGERAVATGYCCLTLSAGNMEFGIQGPDCIEVNTVKPATKIQRDLLFQKMKEAGYEWSKEIKKVKEKFTWSEDDSVRLQRIIDFLWYNRKGDTDTIYQQEQDIDWLKSFKHRIGE